jgi:putative nucleotidyltransferase with HDIG domain
MVFDRKLSNKEKKIIEKIIKFVEIKHHGWEAHDYSHIMAVTKNAIDIAKKIKDPIDPFVLICGALLHDIGRINSTSGSFHGIDGGSRAEEYMESLIDDEYIIRKITRIVVRHTPKSFIAPETPEEKIVYDADAMDRLGVIGMIRGVMDKKGTIHSILTEKMSSRMDDYKRMNYEESRVLAKNLHKQTIEMVKYLKESMDSRYKDFLEVKSLRIINKN